jgi:flap endonuclease-1
MGIRNLNRYLRDNCPESIRAINIADLSGKRIAVDISIYLYKYEAENALLENMYTMLSIFRYYNIIPIFIFDGKPPPEKKALLIKRQKDREDARTEYNKLKQQLENKEDDYNQDIIDAMDQLKKQIIQINKEKIEQVKELIRAYGSIYYDAPGEADELCALLVIKKKVWACLSEDMDLFVYGCSRVLRYFSLIAHTAVLYYTKGILNELNMTQNEFKEICILSGTDYNINASSESSTCSNLRLTIKHFKKFKSTNHNDTFYNWLIENTDYITDIELLLKINSMFSLDSYSQKLDIFKNIKIVNGPIRQNEIENIMKNEDFIFCKNS